MSSSVSERRRQRKFSTKSPSEMTNLQWKVENFKAMVDLVEPLKSAHLTFEAGHSIDLPTTWKFVFETRDVAYGKLGIYLDLLDFPKDCKEVYVMVEILVKNSNGTNFEHLKLEKPMNMVEIWGWGFPDFLGPLSEALPVLPGVLVNGSLVVEINFEIFSFGKAGGSVINAEHNSADKIARFEEKSKNCIADDLMTLLDNRHGCPSDFKIIMKDGKEFPVHKTILGSRSPVFLAMITSDMAEASSGIVHVDDLSSEAMGIVLKFMYSGSVDENWKEWVEELVYAAEKYSLTLLKEFCDTMLLDAVTPENFIDILKLARKFKLETAVSDLAEYASQNIKKIIDVAVL